MEQAIVYALALFGLGILAAVLFRRARWTMAVLLSILIYVPSLFVWFVIQYLQIVPVDFLLKRFFGVESHQLVGTTLGTVVLFGPPLLPSIVILLLLYSLRGREIGA